MSSDLHTERDTQGRLKVHVSALAEHLEHRHHHADATPASTRRAAGVAVELGMAALTCRPEHLTVAAAALAEAQAECSRAAGGTSRTVELTTTLEFQPGHAGLAPVDVLIAEARQLRAQGATDLAVIANRNRLSPDMVAFERTLTALCEDEALVGGRIRVHLDTTGLAPEEIAEAAARCERAGAWMVQTGTWQGERTGFTHTQMVRRAVSSHVLVKWAYPIQTPATLLLCISEGIDRFNADAPATLLRQAQRTSDDGWLTVPLEGVDF